MLVGALLFYPLAAFASVDLDATYIERTPRYPMYQWCYDAGYSGDTNPHLCPDSEINDYRHYPEIGEVMTFTAHIKNRGDTASGSFDYRWLFDGPVVSSGACAEGLDPGEELTAEWQWTWDGQQHDLEFRVDPENTVTEVCEANNTISEQVLDLAFYFVFGEEYYQALSALENPVGSYSADDWLRYQVNGMNQALADSVHPLAPGGCLERIRIDKIEILPNAEAGAAASCPPRLTFSWFFDGRWAFHTSATDPDEIGAAAESYAQGHVDGMDWNLVHELGHQLGLIDIYRMVVHPQNNYVQDDEGRFFNEGYWTQSMPYIMGTPGLAQIFSESSACYLNRKLHERTGAFGYYLWDIPLENKLRVLDTAGGPLPNAHILVYQSKLGSCVRNRIRFEGYTDENGVFSLGDTPFGEEINNWGTNGLLFAVIEAQGQRGTAWLEIIDFNRAYWAGQVDEAWYDVHSGIAPQLADPTNIALGKVATASSSGRAFSPAYAVDGNLHTPNQAWSAQYGDSDAWWQVDLGAIYNVYKVSVYGRPANLHDWFQQFHIDVSVTGAFEGEEETVAIEEHWDQTRIPNGFPVSYNFPPTGGRFVRLVADGVPYGQLQELEVFRVLESGPVPDPPEPGLLPALLGTFIINEFFVNPGEEIQGEDNGDANRDGVADPLDDQFIEIVNVSRHPLDLEGLRVVTNGPTQPTRHTFSQGDIIQQGCAAVVFGGGTPTGEFAGSLVTTASTGTLSMNTDEGSIWLWGTGAPYSMRYRAGGAVRARSRSRLPDVAGFFGPHPYQSPDFNGYFSPGFRYDGHPFPEELLTHPCTFHVDSSQGDDARTPEEACNFLTPWRTIGHALECPHVYSGDTIVVAQGTYHENIDFNGKAVTLRSTSPNDPEVVAATVIDGGQNGRVVTFDSGEGRGAVLNGFTIQNGAGQSGGGILCTSADPTIMNNVITNNSAQMGGGILCAAADALLANNIITGNSADFGGGISCSASYPTITNNTIVNNSARHWGGGIHCVNSSPVVTNSILWANEALTGAQIDIREGSDPVVMYCDIQGGWVGEGNIDGDPLLSDPTAYDFHLTYGSPCIDTGTDSGLTEDFEDDPRPLDGDFDGAAGFDMGADEYNPAGMDSDGDGLTDAYEASIGTSPSEEDTDGDGLIDYAEVYWDGSGEYDPYDPVANPAGKDTDANESDTDEDGYSDYIEFYFGSDPTDENVTPHIIKMNFQPMWATPPPDFCPVGAELHTPRGYGWR